jgi:hypothetical protein
VISRKWDFLLVKLDGDRGRYKPRPAAGVIRLTLRQSSYMKAAMMAAIAQTNSAAKSAQNGSLASP